MLRQYTVTIELESERTEMELRIHMRGFANNLVTDPDRIAESIHSIKVEEE